MEATDLKIIQQLYFPKETSILLFDPNHLLKGDCPNAFVLVKSIDELTRILGTNESESYIIFNLSKSTNAFNCNDKHIENIVHFNQNNSTNDGVKNYFVNNNNGTIRWIFPATNKSAVFLSLYNNSGWKAKLYKAFVKIGVMVGFEKLFSQGYFTFENQTASLYDFLPNKYHDDYAVFTGTVGENRKAIVAVAGNKQVNSFVKIPLTQKAKSLVRNEMQQLNYINQLRLTKMRTPKCAGTADHLELSNIKPVDSIHQSNLTEQHLLGISECYNKSIQEINPQATSAWSEIQSNLRILNDDFKIKNDLDNQKVKNMINHLNHLVDWIGASEKLPVGLAHGDFTPWNMYLTKEKIHVYDWEMCTSDMPLLFDVFHFVFQNQILINQGNFDTVQSELKSIQQNKIVENVVSDYSINWSMHYAFYIVYITSYYLPLYINQQDLHMQAHWLIDVWSDALEALNQDVSKNTFIPA